MVSPQHAANGNSGGPSGHRGSQAGSNTHRGATAQSPFQSTKHCAIAIDFNISDWILSGKPAPSFTGRVQDFANAVTKNCPEVQLAPLPHLSGGESLPFVGRADKTADDIYAIPKDKFEFYAKQGRTWTERSTGRTMMQGFIGLRPTISPSTTEIKERKGVNELLTKKNREIYFRLNNTSSLGTVPIGFLFRIHTALSLCALARVSAATSSSTDSTRRGLYLMDRASPTALTLVQKDTLY